MGLDIEKEISGSYLKKLAHAFDKGNGLKNANGKIDDAEFSIFQSELKKNVDLNLIPNNEKQEFEQIMGLSLQNIQESEDSEEVYVYDDVYGSEASAIKQETKNFEAKTVTKPQKEVTNKDVLRANLDKSIADKTKVNILMNIIGDFSTKEDVDNMYKNGKKALKKANLWGKDYKEALTAAQVTAEAILVLKQYNKAEEVYDKAYQADLAKSKNKLHAHNEAMKAVKSNKEFKGQYYDAFKSYQHHGLNLRGQNHLDYVGVISSLEGDKYSQNIIRDSKAHSKETALNGLEDVRSREKQHAKMQTAENRYNYRKDRLYTENEIVNGYEYKVEEDGMILEVTNPSYATSNGELIKVKGLGQETFDKLNNNGYGYLKNIYGKYDLSQLAYEVGTIAGIDFEQNVTKSEMRPMEERHDTADVLNSKVSGLSDGDAKDIAVFLGLDRQSRIKFDPKDAAVGVATGGLIAGAGTLVAETLNRTKVYSGELLVNVVKDLTTNVVLDVNEQVVLETIIKKHKTTSATDPGDEMPIPPEYEKKVGTAMLVGALAGSLAGISENTEKPVMIPIKCEIFGNDIERIKRYIGEKTKGKDPKIAMILKDIADYYYDEKTGVFNCNEFNKDLLDSAGNLILNKDELWNKAKKLFNERPKIEPKVTIVSAVAHDECTDPTDTKVPVTEYAKENSQYYIVLAKRYDCNLATKPEVANAISECKVPERVFLERMMKVMQGVRLVNSDQTLSLDRLVELTKIAIKAGHKNNNNIKDAFAKAGVTPEEFSVETYIKYLHNGLGEQKLLTLKASDGTTCNYKKGIKVKIDLPEGKADASRKGDKPADTYSKDHKDGSYNGGIDVNYSDGSKDHIPAENRQVLDSERKALEEKGIKVTDKTTCGK